MADAISDAIRSVRCADLTVSGVRSRLIEVPLRFVLGTSAAAVTRAPILLALGAGLGERHEAELVDDQQLLAGEALLQALQAAFVGGLNEFVDRGSGGGEADLQPLLAGGEPKTESDIGRFRMARARSSNAGADQSMMGRVADGFDRSARSICRTRPSPG